MDFLVRLAQVHESFRKAELESLAVLTNNEIEFVYYSDNSPFCIIRLPSEDAAKAIIRRSILSQGIYEFWGQGQNYAQLHEDVKRKGLFRRPEYKSCSFKLSMDGYQIKRSQQDKTQLFQSFAYFGFDGPIRMKDPELEICIFELGEVHNPEALQHYCGRFIAKSDRDAAEVYNLKKRRYISRTSMDAELSLVTANMCLAASGKVLYDPFVGTGSFSVACSHFGAMALGSDIDGRAVRGTPNKTIFSNFEQYGLTSNYFDMIIADLVHTPLRTGRYMDGIVIDPPYGIREGPRVLGSRDGKEVQAVLIDGVPAHTREGYIPPKRAYGFDDMMEDILEFAFLNLVDKGRICLWMPTANDEDIELAIPKHPGLELLHVSVQEFYKWSRRLLTYERKCDAMVKGLVTGRQRERVQGQPNDINKFRKKYFDGFRDPIEK